MRASISVLAPRRDENFMLSNIIQVAYPPWNMRLQNRMWLSTTLEFLGRVMRRRLSKNTEKHVDEVGKQCQGTSLHTSYLLSR